jgi:hypothetical protein
MPEMKTGSRSSVFFHHFDPGLPREMHSVLYFTGVNPV